MRGSAGIHGNGRRSWDPTKDLWKIMKNARNGVALSSRSVPDENMMVPVDIRDAFYEFPKGFCL